MLEHINITVSDPERTANMLCDVFGWRIRWSGPAKGGGHTFHVGTDDSYVAVFSAGGAQAPNTDRDFQRGGLNHVGVRVDNLEAVEARVVKAGYAPHSHADYEPGRRFYFNDHDDIEFEVVTYAA